MIRFDDWKISCAGNLLAMQYDHLSRELQVSGCIPEGYEWMALVRAGEYLDIIPLSEAKEGLSAVLTAQQLCLSGCYELQLRGTRGEEVRHTNLIQVYVGDSLSGNETWPELTGEFIQLEQRIRQALETVADNAVGGTPAVQVLAESGILTPAYDDGRFCTDADGAIYIL